MLKYYIHFCDALFDFYGYEKSVQILSEKLHKTRYLSCEFFASMADLYLMRYRHGKYPSLFEWTEFVHYFRNAK